ncbi:MAG: AIR synthase-related protein [Thiobacillaceae bacterium]
MDSWIWAIDRDDIAGTDLKADFFGQPFGEVLLTPTRIYVKPLLSLIRTLRVKGMAHITGGGLTGNIPRVLPDSCAAQLHWNAWQRAPLFDWLQRTGNVADAEMHRTFNCGVGMVVIVAKEDADAALAHLNAAGETVWQIGEIVLRESNGAQVMID